MDQKGAVDLTVRKFNTPQFSYNGRKAACDFPKHFPNTFPVCGTLLGMIRDDNVIPHDSDVDFGCLAWPHKPMPKQIGPFTRWKTFHYKGNVVEIAYKHKVGVKVDLFYFFPEGGSLCFAAWADEFPRRKTILRKFPKELFEKFEPLTAFGTSFHSIAEPKKFLECNYGPNWQTPDSTFDYRTSPQR